MYGCCFRILKIHYNLFMIETHIPLVQAVNGLQIMDKRQTQPQRNSTSNTSSAPSTRSQRPNVKTADSRNSTMSSTSPSSALLQDLLREKKSSHQKRHQSRRIPSDNGYDDRPVQSSPIAPPNKDVYPDTERRTSIGAGGSGRPKEMGAREMDEV